jgi:hypothetical protein
VEVPVQRLFAKIGELTVLLELAQERITALEAAAPPPDESQRTG